MLFQPDRPSPSSRLTVLFSSLACSIQSFPRKFIFHSAPAAHLTPDSSRSASPSWYSERSHATLSLLESNMDSASRFLPQTVRRFLLRRFHSSQESKVNPMSSPQLSNPDPTKSITKLRIWHGEQRGSIFAAHDVSTDPWLVAYPLPFSRRIEALC